MRQNLALVRLDHQHTLLPFADPVQFRVGSQVEGLVVERVVELLHTGPLFARSANAPMIRSTSSGVL